MSGPPATCGATISAAIPISFSPDENEALQREITLAPYAHQISLGLTALQERQTRLEAQTRQHQNSTDAYIISQDEQMVSLTDEVHEVSDQLANIDSNLQAFRVEMARFLPYAQSAGAFGPPAVPFGGVPAPVAGPFGGIPAPAFPGVFGAATEPAAAAAPMDMDGTRGRDMYTNRNSGSRRTRRAASRDVPYQASTPLLGHPLTFGRSVSPPLRTRAESPSDPRRTRTSSHCSPPRGTRLSPDRSSTSPAPRRRRARSRSRSRSRSPPARSQRRARSRTPSPGPKPHFIRNMAPDKFTGTDQNFDLDDWITQVERYFRLTHTPDRYMVDLAAAFLSGPASKAWAGIEKTMKQKGEEITIEDFYQTMKTNFGQVFPEMQIRKALKSLKQETTVAKYARLFQAKVGQLIHKPMAQADQIDYFLNGLKEPIRRQCHWNPGGNGPFASLSKLIEYAISYELSQRENHQTSASASASAAATASAADKGQKRGTELYHKNKGFNQNTKFDSSKPAKSAKTFDNVVSQQKPWFTPKYPRGSREWLFIVQHGLCFHCMSDLHTTRDCPAKKEKQSPKAPSIPDNWQPDPPAERPCVPVASLDATCPAEVKSATLPPANTCTVSADLSEAIKAYIRKICAEMCCSWEGKTRLRMLVKGKTAEHDIEILLDTGATKSCISTSTFSKRQWILLPGQLEVTAFDGSQQTSSGFAKVSIAMGNYHEELNLAVVAMPHFDVILGEDWLARHAASLYYKGSFVAKFEHQGTEYSLPAVLPEQQHVQHIDAFDTSAFANEPEWAEFDKHTEFIEFDKAAVQNEQQHTKFDDTEIISAMSFLKIANAPVSEQTFVVRIRAVPDTIEIASATEAHTPESVMNDKINQLMQAFPDVLCTAQPQGLPPSRPTVPTIPLVNENLTVYKQMYRLSPAEKAELQKQLADLLKRGHIQPSVSPFGSPILFVKKKDGSQRMVIDYRSLNKLTVKNRYPLPRIDDLLDRLHGAKYFSSLDLMSGYHQIRLHESDVPKTAFRTPSGLYEFLVLPFGLTNAPATFQTEMNRLFSHLPYVIVYLDDLLIFSTSEEEHEQHVREVLSILRREQLIAKAVKCIFFQPSLPFLGHIISSEGVTVDPSKIAVVQQWPQPTSTKHVQKFLGLSNYFREYVQGYSKLAGPLTDIASEHKEFKWDADQHEAFAGVKYALTHAPCLAYPDFNKPFQIVTDASGYGIGAVLMQDKRPISFFSQKLKPSETRYSTSDKELLAVYKALVHFRCYVQGRDFTLITDHKPNTGNFKALTSMQVKWITFVESFKTDTPGKGIQIVYQPGRTNVADPLSRHPSFLSPLITRRKKRLEQHSQQDQQDQQNVQPVQPRQPQPLAGLGPSSCCEGEGTRPTPANTAGSTAAPTPAVILGLPPPPPPISPDFEQQIIQGYSADPWFAEQKNVSRLEHKGGYWFNKEAIVIPNQKELKNSILYEFHDIPSAGHVGIDNTFRAVRRHFYWPNMRREIEQYVQTCECCQRNKASHQKAAGLLQPLPIPRYKWTDISMDFITQLPLTKSGYDAILVVVDRCTKMCHFIPTRTSVDAEETAQLFLDNIFRLHGVPDSIVSDRDTRFTGHFMRALCDKLQIKQKMSTAYHPQTDGQTERLNRVIEDMLRNYVGSDQKDWDKFLSQCEFAANNRTISGTDVTPFFLNSGYHPKVALVNHSRGLDCEGNPTAEKLTRDMQQALNKARDCLLRAQDRARKYANQHRREVEYNVGDKVLLSTKNLRFTGKQSNKFMSKYIGPFEIIKKVNSVAYKLKLPEKSKVFHTFHVSLLRPYNSDESRNPPAGKPEELEGENVFTVEKILDHKDKKRPGKAKNKHKRMFLIRWAGYTPSDDTWEPEENLLECKEALAEYWRTAEARGRSVDQS